MRRGRRRGGGGVERSRAAAQLHNRERGAAVGRAEQHVDA